MAAGEAPLPFPAITGWRSYDEENGSAVGVPAVGRPVPVGVLQPRSALCGESLYARGHGPGHPSGCAGQSG